MVVIKNSQRRSITEGSSFDPLFDVPTSTTDGSVTVTASRVETGPTSTIPFNAINPTIIMTATSTSLTPAQSSQAASNASYTSILIGGVIGGCLCLFIVVFFVGRIVYLQSKHGSSQKNARK
ncbi:hypothetical protein CPB86DRAFT_780822 [Serendipita vermifera]|nr:hypothetical protein CPB86DRAFT_780822 [Serendipita vermifera]